VSTQVSHGEHVQVKQRLVEGVSITGDAVGEDDELIYIDLFGNLLVPSWVLGRTH
jgi:hypothetical protein